MAQCAMWLNCLVNSADLPLTGERTVPGIALERYWFLRHEVVYQHLGQWLRQRWQPTGVDAITVLDAGMGEGYGINSLGQQLRHDFPSCAVTAIGVDYDEQSVSHAQSRYPAIQAIRANLAALPCADASVDAVVSLQVIEHIWDLAGFLRECHRVLRPGGVIVVSTPNRPVFSPGIGRGDKPTNPFHVEEFDAAQVQGMLTSAGFDEVEVIGLHHGGAITAWEAQHGPVVAAHIEAAMTSTWSADLLSLLRVVSNADFTFGDPIDSQDLIGFGRR